MSMPVNILDKRTVQIGFIGLDRAYGVILTGMVIPGVVALFLAAITHSLKLIQHQHCKHTAMNPGTLRG